MNKGRRISQIKYGAIMSYILLAISTVYGLLITPFILQNTMGDAYGVYKSIGALCSSIAVMDFGIGSTMIRYIAKYNATGEKEKENNFIAMMLTQLVVLAALIVGAGVFFYCSIDRIYAQSFSDDQLLLAKQIFIILLTNLVLKVFENLLYGISAGHERFVFSNSVKILSMLCNAALVMLFLPITKSIFVVVLSNTVVTICGIVAYIIYNYRELHIWPKLIKWDWKLFKESFVYSALMFIQTLVVQFSGNLDNIFIGARISAASVTVYSMALSLHGMYSNLSGSISNLMLPRFTKAAVRGDSAQALQDEVEKFSRYQYFLLAGALGGFVALGREFFFLWVGEEFSDCYGLTLILMFAATLPTIGSVSLSILRAQNKMGYRIATVSIACVFNCVITLIGLKYWGYWGAAIGTAADNILNLLFMNAYYHRKLGFHVLRLYYNVAFKTTLCAAVPTIVLYFMKPYFVVSWVAFALQVLLFLVIYVLMLFAFSMNSNERHMIFGRMKNVICLK